MRLRAFVSGLFVLAGVTLAVPRPGFDPKNVVYQVRHSTTRPHDPSTAGFDDGEFLIDTNPKLLPAPSWQEKPAIEFGTADYLAVWGDERSDMYGDIWGGRLNTRGTVVDLGGRRICTVSYIQVDPAMARSHTNYLVVWEDDNNMSGAIYGTRVTFDGAVLDTPNLVISAVEASRSASTCSNGHDFLVVWQDDRNSTDRDICAARVTSEGTLLDTVGIAVCVAAGNQRSPCVGFDGVDFVVAWEDYRGASCDIRAARVTWEGVVLDTSGIVVCDAQYDQSDPAIASDGTNSLIVWRDYRGITNGDIYAARLTRQGAVLDSSGFAVSAAGGNQVAPSVAFGGSCYLVAWEDNRSDSQDIYAARISTRGVLLDRDGIAVSTPAGAQGRPDVATDGYGFMVVWQEGADIFGSRVNDQGVVLDPQGIIVAASTNEQLSPSVSPCGDAFLALWQDWQGSTDYDILGSRVRAPGIVLDSSVVVVSAVTTGEMEPVTAQGDSCLLTAWSDRRNGLDPDIYAARVSLSGLVLDTAGFGVSRIGGSEWSPAVSTDGTDFLVAWVGRVMHPGSIQAARVSSQGVLLDSAAILISGSGYPMELSGCYGGDDYLVVWTDHTSVRAARVTPQGRAMPVAIVSGSPGTKGSPTACFDDADYLIVWEDKRSGTYDIYAARMTPQGNLLDSAGIAVCAAPGDQTDPAVCFDGTNSLVVWEDRRSGQDCDLYGARVRPDGTVFDSGPVVRQVGDQMRPVLACLPGAQMFLVYQGWAGSVGNKIYNAYRTWGKLGPFPGVEEGAKPQAASLKPQATIVRGVLRLQVDSRQNTGCRVGAELLDASGRKVMDLVPGVNDVSRLALGVYFVTEQLKRKLQAQAQKVVIQR